MDAFDLDRILRESRICAVDYRDEVDSTNTRALEIAAAGTQGTPLRELASPLRELASPLRELASPLRELAFPLLVLADRQNAGRGRGHNRWWAGTGGLTFSLLVNGPSIQLSPRDWPLISLATGLAVAETIERLCIVSDVQLKWPNDVLLAGRKVSGILVETSSQRPGAIVIGVGVNVNNSFRDAPLELQSTGISLCDFVGRSLNRTDVLIGILRRMADQLERMENDRWHLADDWRKRCALQGRTIQLNSGTQSIAGVCQGIDDTGALLLHTENGIERCYGGVVTRIL